MKKFIVAVLTSTAFLPVAAFAQSQSGQQTGQSADATNDVRQTTASDVRGKQVVNSDGEEIGRIQHVVRNADGQSFAVVSFNDNAGVSGDPRLAPIGHLFAHGDRLGLIGNTTNWRQLPAYRAGSDQFRDVEGKYKLSLAGQPSGLATSRILLQPNSAFRIEQAAPRVTVHQAQPKVTVRQPQPEIIIRQPQPTIRVDIPQPQITLRMPDPDVNVSTQPPRVSVQQAQPKAEIVQSQQDLKVHVERQPSSTRNIDVQQAQPRVDVTRAEGQPQVRYERAEPRVLIAQPKGEPSVTIERMHNGEPHQATHPAGQEENDKADRRADVAPLDNAAATHQAAGKQDHPQQQAGERKMTDQERDKARARLQVDDRQAAGQATRKRGPARVLAVDQLDGMTVFNARGDRLGEVGKVVADANGKYHVVIEHGGFLGIGNDDVSFPIERFWLKDDALVIRNVSEGDIEAMDDYRSTAESYQEVSDNASAQLRVWQ